MSGARSVHTWHPRRNIETQQLHRGASRWRARSVHKYSFYSDNKSEWLSSSSLSKRWNFKKNIPYQLLQLSANCRYEWWQRHRTHFWCNLPKESCLLFSNLARSSIFKAWKFQKTMNPLENNEGILAIVLKSILFQTVQIKMRTIFQWNKIFDYKKTRNWTMKSVAEPKDPVKMKQLWQKIHAPLSIRLYSCSIRSAPRSKEWQK